MGWRGYRGCVVADPHQEVRLGLMQHLWLVPSMRGGLLGAWLLEILITIKKKDSEVG